ncbi:hypothetical protein EV714DRAFT_268373 [Schizophyllum commune]
MAIGAPNERVIHHVVVVLQSSTSASLLVFTSMPNISLRAVLSFAFAICCTPVLAQAPVNDIVGWPTGLLLLATCMYVILGTKYEDLWSIDPSTGPFLWSGFPMHSIPALYHSDQTASVCHFLPRVRTVFGPSTIWAPSEKISQEARADVLRKATKVIHPVLPDPQHTEVDQTWLLEPSGLLRQKEILENPGLAPSEDATARDFLLFAAIEYFRLDKCRCKGVEVCVYRGTCCLFSTKGLPRRWVMDVDNEEMALRVVAAILHCHPHVESQLSTYAVTGPPSCRVQLDQIDAQKDLCIVITSFGTSVDDKCGVHTSLNELAKAYFIVVQHHKKEPDVEKRMEGYVAIASVKQTMWLAIFGGALLESGRLTIQNLQGYREHDMFIDQAFSRRIEHVLDTLSPRGNDVDLTEITHDFMPSKRSALSHVFFVAGLLGQMITSYFLCASGCVGTWSSVALANSLYSGRLSDWHTRSHGGASGAAEAGIWMQAPFTKDVMCFATLDRSMPRVDKQRPGILLNVCGIAAAIMGVVFQQQTRTALGFDDAPSLMSPSIAFATSVVITFLALLFSVFLGLTDLETLTDSDRYKWIWTSTAVGMVIASVLGNSVYYARNYLCEQTLWITIDVTVWITGLPLGWLLNGQLPVDVDHTVVHFALASRWMMGALASLIRNTDLGEGVQC